VAGGCDPGASRATGVPPVLLLDQLLAASVSEYADDESSRPREVDAASECDRCLRLLNQLVLLLRTTLETGCTKPLAIRATVSTCMIARIGRTRLRSVTLIRPTLAYDCGAA
jgi:hypothetical protein